MKKKTADYNFDGKLDLGIILEENSTFYSANLFLQKNNGFQLNQLPNFTFLIDKIEPIAVDIIGNHQTQLLFSLNNIRKIAYLEKNRLILYVFLFLNF